MKHILAVLLCLTALLSLVGTAYARVPEGPTAAVAQAPAAKIYPQLQADFNIYNWRKSDTPFDLIGTMHVNATGGDGRYTYEFIGTRLTSTFDFRWQQCSVLVNSLVVRSGDGQKVVLPVWRDDLPCYKHWKGADD